MMIANKYLQESQSFSRKLRAEEQEMPTNGEGGKLTIVYQP
jgi:hypothetical protein